MKQMGFDLLPYLCNYKQQNIFKNIMHSYIKYGEII
jgi:hypothetical protein